MKFKLYVAIRQQYLGASVSKSAGKKVSEDYLERAALHYLGRYSSTAANLKAVLARKVRRRNPENEPPSSEQAGWIDNVAEKCVRLGYVDDAVYARQRLESLQRRGKPLRAIAQDLRHKGVPDDILSPILAEMREDEGTDPDLAAAAAYVRRRRFGVFRRVTCADEIEARLEKEKAAMMRAGFPYRLVAEVLESSEDEIMALLP